MSVPSGYRREDIVSRAFLPADVAEVLLTAGGTARRAVESVVDAWLQSHGGGGGGGLSAEDRASLVAFRSRTDTSEQAPTATNWSARPAGFGCVVAVGSAPSPADAGPLDVRIDRDPSAWSSVVTTFSGQDGSAWPAPWTVERVPAGGGATVSGGKGYLTTGAAGSSSAADQVAARYGGSDYADVDVLLTFRHSTSAARPRLVLRSDTAALNGNTAARVTFGTDSLQVQDVVSGTATTVATAAKTLTVGADYRLRVTASAGTVQARVWALAESEPAGWDVTAEVAKTTAGYLGLVVAGTTSTTGAAQTVAFDDISVTATSSGGYGFDYGNHYGA